MQHSYAFPCLCITISKQTLFVAFSAPGDYTEAIETLTFLAGISSILIPVNISDDIVVEGTENFMATLMDSNSGLALGDQSTVTVHILDNDGISILIYS